MKLRGVALTLGIAAGAGVLAARGLVKNKELAQKAKEEGGKIFNSAKNLSDVIKEAANNTVAEVKKTVASKASDFMTDVHDKEDKAKTAEETEETEATEDTTAEETEETEETEDTEDTTD